MPKPEDLPESIVLGAFGGIKNTVSRERLQPADLMTARNVDIDDAGQARRRRGYAAMAAGSFHSLKNVGEVVYGVRDGLLGVVNPDYTFTSLGVSGGVEPISYTAVGDTVYYTSLDVSGKVTGGVAEDWGVRGGDGIWVSPVMTPTDTLGQVYGQNLHAPPVAALCERYNGRIYLAAGRYLWATELYLYDYVDRTRNFFQFEADITLLLSVDDGLYVGTKDRVHFLGGAMSTGLRLREVLEVGAIPGSAVAVHSSDLRLPMQEQPAEGPAGMVLTQRGVYALLAGGTTLPLTRGRAEFPSAQSAAALHREDSGVSSYLAVTNSSGGPSANVRIGDFVDAEIVRLGS